MSSGATRVYYNPPKGYPPLTFPSSMSEKTFMPPDQYWMRAKEEYVQGVIMHPKLGTPMVDPRTGKAKEVKGIRKIWVVDVQKNKELEAGTIPPPKNYLFCTAEDLIELKAGRYGSYEFQGKTYDLRAHLKKIEDIEREQGDEVVRLKHEHDLQLDELQKNHEAKIRRIQRDMAIQEEKELKKKRQGVGGVSAIVKEPDLLGADGTKE